MDGTEIVQLYVSPGNKTLGLKPIQLKGFKRVNLKVGEEKRVEFLVSPQQLAQFENNKWFVLPGKYEFKIGASCTDIRGTGTIEIDGKKRLLKNGRQVFFAQTNTK